MPDRLTALEQTTLALDTARTPAVVGTVAIFDPGPTDLDDERLAALVRDRIRYVPRYRQRVLGVPGRLADPVWVDDADFDLTFHLRRSVLPRPGNRDQLRDFVGRVLSRRMDRSRPLWELYLVQGLENDRFALVAKTHQCLVDGVDTVDLMQVLLDNEPDDSLGPEESWHPIPAPGPMELVAGAVTEGLRDPARTVTNLQHAMTDAFGAAVTAGEAIGLGGPIADLAVEAIRGAAAPNRTPLVGSVSDQRRMEVVRVALDDLRAVRAESDHTVNDVLLEMITGGLRSWLMTRGENVGPEASLTALVPTSVVAEDDDQTSLGSRVEERLVALPIGEPSSSIRMARIASETQAHKESGHAIGARELSEIAGFAPATLHDLGARGTGRAAHHPYDVLISNAPGPQAPVYLGLAQMTASYPVIPLSAGHLLAIGITSYNGTVLIGLNADRGAFGDLDVLAQGILDELDDLTDAVLARRQPTRAAGADVKAARRQAKRAATQKVKSSTRQPPKRPAADTRLLRKAANRTDRRSGRQDASGVRSREERPGESAQEGDH